MKSFQQQSSHIIVCLYKIFGNPNINVQIHSTTNYLAKMSVRMPPLDSFLMAFYDYSYLKLYTYNEDADRGRHGNRS